MRSRFISENSYTYSVKYNYVGGKIYANDVIVGTITDINVPVIFHSKDPQVTIRADLCPDTEYYSEVTSESTSWGRATSITGYIHFDLQSILNFASNILEVIYRLNDRTDSIIRDFNTWETVKTTTTSYSPPASMTVTPGEYSLEYKKDVKTSNSSRIKSTESRKYQLQSSDEFSYNITISINLEYDDGTSEYMNQKNYENVKEEDFYWTNLKTYVGAPMDKRILSSRLDNISGEMEMFRFKVPIKR